MFLKIYSICIINHSCFNLVHKNYRMFGRFSFEFMIIIYVIGCFIWKKIFDIYNILETKFFLFFCFCSIFENPQYINSYWCSSYFQDKIPSYFLEEFYHELCRRFTMSFLHKFMNFGEFSRMIIFFDCFLLKSSFPLYVSRKNDKNSS